MKIVAGRGKKKARNFGPPPFGAPLGPFFFWVSAPPLCTTPLTRNKNVFVPMFFLLSRLSFVILSRCRFFCPVFFLSRCVFFRPGPDHKRSAFDLCGTSLAGVDDFISLFSNLMHHDVHLWMHLKTLIFESSIVNFT